MHKKEDKEGRTLTYVAHHITPFSEYWEVFQVRQRCPCGYKCYDKADLLYQNSLGESHICEQPCEIFPGSYTRLKSLTRSRKRRESNCKGPDNRRVRRCHSERRKA